MSTGKMLAAAAGSFGIWATNLELALKAAAAGVLLAYMILRFVREFRKDDQNEK